ncbi:Uncharacterised protein [Vibrio cholerae]|nr:Uncharacterised protein [Vibrio cholerae]
MRVLVDQNISPHKMFTQFILHPIRDLMCFEQRNVVI